MTKFTNISLVLSILWIIILVSGAGVEGFIIAMIYIPLGLVTGIVGVIQSMKNKKALIPSIIVVAIPLCFLYLFLYGNPFSSLPRHTLPW